jgi:hypothetical protein
MYTYIYIYICISSHFKLPITGQAEARVKLQAYRDAVRLDDLIDTGHLFLIIINIFFGFMPFWLVY